MKEGNIICIGPERLNQALRVFACHKFGLSSRTQNCFSMIARNEKEEFMHWVTTMLLLFRLRLRTDSGRTWYIFLQYMEYTPALDRVNEKLA